VGGYFGGRLARAGHDVAFIARGATLTALRRDGLRVASVDGDFAIQPAHATDDPSDVGPVDVVVFGVKAWQIPAAAEAARPLFGPGTAALPLQNGVAAPAELDSVLGAGVALGGLCRIFAAVATPGSIRHLGVDPSVELGEMDDRPSDRVEALRAAFAEAGVTVAVPASIAAAMWEKFLFIVPTSSVGSVTRATLGEIRRQPATRRLLEDSAREIWELARARGVPVRDDAVERTLHFVDSLPAEATASMQRDVVAGNPSELEAQAGTVVRLAAEAGVDAPVNGFLYAALLPGETRAREGA
jgi:2-dehydropantoate 2-reductase